MRSLHFTPDSVPWLAIHPQNGLVVNNKGQGVLKNVHEHVNLVLIFGKMGQGKSFLMNCLADQDVFGVSCGLKSCTQGIDLSSHLIPNPTGEDGAPLIGFVDAEGQGDDKGPSHELMLATPMLMTSKVVIMNIMEPIRPSKETLRGLKILMETAGKISKQDRKKGVFGNLHYSGLNRCH